MMPDDVQVLLNNISNGFRESLPEAIITSLLVAFFAGGLVYFYVRQQREERRSRTELYRARYEALLRGLDLPTGSIALFDRMARYLRDSSRRFMLLENEATFNSCLRKLTAREEVSPALVATIRMRLGYRALNPEKAPLTSGDVAEETVVLLERPAKTPGDKARFAARIVSVEPNALVLETKGENDLRRGDPVKLYFYNFAGLYMFTTRVTGLRDGFVLVAHSSSITAVQRRRYYRRKLSAPVYIRRVGGEELFIKTLIQDLGGGGARVVNPHDLFELHDRVELALDLGLHKWLRVAGEVVRVGRDATISLRFDDLRESTRDLILRSLFKRYNAYLRERNQEEESATQ